MKTFVIWAANGSLHTRSTTSAGEPFTASTAYSAMRELQARGYKARFAREADLQRYSAAVAIEAGIAIPAQVLPELHVRLFLEAGRNANGPWGRYILSSGGKKAPLEKSASMAPETGAYEAHAETLFEALSTLEVALTSDQLQRCTLTVAGTGTVSAVLRCAQRCGLKADGKPGQSSEVLAKAGAILKKLKGVSFE